MGWQWCQRVPAPSTLLPAISGTTPAAHRIATSLASVVDLSALLPKDIIQYTLIRPAYGLSQGRTGGSAVRPMNNDPEYARGRRRQG